MEDHKHASDEGEGLVAGAASVNLLTETVHDDHDEDVEDGGKDGDDNNGHDDVEGSLVAGTAAGIES